VSVYHVRGKHLKLIAFHYAKHNIRGGAGVVFTFLVLTVGLLIAGAVIAPVEYLQKEIKKERERGDGPRDAQVFPRQPRAAPDERVKAMTDEEITREMLDRLAKEARGPIKWILGADDDQVDYLVRDKPALVSAVILWLMWCLPFLVVLGAFNQMAGDIQHRGLRYLLLRTERANLFLGRFLGTLLFTMSVLFILLSVVFLYLVLKTKYYSPGEIALWMAQGLVMMAILALPYIALCAWMSSTADSPSVALVLILLMTAFVPVLVMVGTNITEHFKYLGYVLPWPLKFELLHPNPLHFLGATAAMLAYTALYLMLGLAMFQKRDL
jgi:ABC-2 type transport system permease protein